MPALSRKMLDDPFKCQEYSTRETWPCQSNIKKTVLPTEFNTYSSRCNTKKGGCWSSYCITVMTPALCMGLGWKHIQSQKLYTLDAGVVKLAACLFFLQITGLAKVLTHLLSIFGVSGPERAVVFPYLFLLTHIFHTTSFNSPIELQIQTACLILNQV